MDEESNDIIDRQREGIIDVLTLIASAIGTQTDYIENVCDSLDEISSRFVTNQTGKPYLIKNTNAEILERIADALERIADNTAAIEALRQEVFVGWTAINRRLAELYQSRKDKETE